MPDQWDSILGLWVEELGTNFFPLDLELSGNEPGKKNLLQRNISRQTNSLMVEKKLLGRKHQGLRGDSDMTGFLLMTSQGDQVLSGGWLERRKYD